MPEVRLDNAYPEVGLSQADLWGVIQRCPRIPVLANVSIGDDAARWVSDNDIGPIPAPPVHFGGNPVLPALSEDLRSNSGRARRKRTWL